MRRHAAFLALTCALTAAAPLTAQQPPSGDQSVKLRVEQRLAERRVRGITVVSARDGSVTLAGPIPSAGAKQDLVAEVLKVDGVREVVSELSIKKSESDRALAERVAEQMRRSSYF